MADIKQFHLPTRIVTGPGCIQGLGQHAAANGHRALLVCGTRALRASGQLGRAQELLTASGVETILYDAVSGEPTMEVVQTGLDRARDEKVAVVVGMGGGSALDTAKAIAGMYSHPGQVEEYLGERRVSGGGLPWIAIPTTAGTGAEVTPNAVLISPRHRVKSSLRHDAWYATVALVDPELTLNVSPQVTATTGSDALTQAIESFTSIAAAPVTDALAAEALTRIGRSLERACRDGQDLAARADMLYGSLLAGMAMSNARLGGVHGMAHPLGYRYHIAHGVVCGLLLPYTMDYNLDYTVNKYARVATLLGTDTQGMSEPQAAKKAVARVRELFRSIGIPEHLAPFGVAAADLEVVAGESMSSSLQHNPRPLDQQDVITILSAAL